MPDAFQDILLRPVDGLNLRPSLLADQLDSRPTLLVFLRHFGCPFCRETIGDLRRTAAENPAFPPIVFFAQGTPEECADFFAERWPEARVIADPQKSFYAAMGLRRGTFGQIYGVMVWTCVVRAMIKGHMIGKPVGDPNLMPGAFLVNGEKILWSHTYRHQGDRPDWSRIPAIAGYAGQSTRVEVR